MSYDFNEKVAFITGAGSGIGRETALLFAKNNAKVVVTDINIISADETVQIIKNNGGNCISIKLDVTNPDEVKSAISKTLEKYKKIDFAFNNAGMGAKAEQITHNYPLDEFKKIIEINLMGVWYCMKEQITVMFEQGNGSIVNTASILGTVGMNGASPYVASKHGVIGLTKTAALEYATKGIRINAVCPGYIETQMLKDNEIVEGSAKYSSLAKMHAMRRMGKPLEIAGAVLWLCSDEASFMTGQSLIIDGGFTAR